MRDYVEWHRAYDDPASSMSWRLGRVRAHLNDELDRRAGPLRVVSVCAGDGRDVLGVLAGRTDAGRVTGTLVELHAGIAATARTAAARLPGVEVRTADAGTTTAYAGAVPADILLLVGVFGNISDADVERVVHAIPALCARDALVLWSRGTDIPGTDIPGTGTGTDGVSRDLNDDVRRWLAATSCTEVSYEVFDGASSERPALGATRFTGEPVALPADDRLFTFVR